MQLAHLAWKQLWDSATFNQIFVAIDPGIRVFAIWVILYCIATDTVVYLIEI